MPQTTHWLTKLDTTWVACITGRTRPGMRISSFPPSVLANAGCRAVKDIARSCHTIPARHPIITGFPFSRTPTFPTSGPRSVMPGRRTTPKYFPSPFPTSRITEHQRCRLSCQQCLTCRFSKVVPIHSKFGLPSSQPWQLTSTFPSAGTVPCSLAARRA